MFIRATYFYYGSINNLIHFEEGKEGFLKLLTDYGEEIAIVHDISELQEVISKLQNDQYDFKEQEWVIFKDENLLPP